MIAAALQLVSCAASAVIIARTFPAVVRMGRATPLPIRIAMHFPLVGAIGEIGSVVLFAAMPPPPTVITLVGLAALILCERRLRALTGPLSRAARQIDPAGPR